MPSYAADETAKRPPILSQREKASRGDGMIMWQWRLACYL